MQNIESSPLLMFLATSPVCLTVNLFSGIDPHRIRYQPGSNYGRFVAVTFSSWTFRPLKIADDGENGRTQKTTAKTVDRENGGREKTNIRRWRTGGKDEGEVDVVFSVAFLRLQFLVGETSRRRNFKGAKRPDTIWLMWSVVVSSAVCA